MKKGRNGLGNIYVWAAGNGNTQFDNCGGDGFIQSIHTIAVGAVELWSNSLKVTSTSSECAAVLVGAMKGQSTIDLGRAKSYTKTNFDPLTQCPKLLPCPECRSGFSGTSAAAPVIAGITALILNAIKNLTWRDMQHVLVASSDVMDTEDFNGGLIIENALRLVYSHRIGFGLPNVLVAVEHAKKWRMVGPQTKCYIMPTEKRSHQGTGGYAVEFKFVVNSNCSITSIEHIQLQQVINMYTIASDGRRVYLQTIKYSLWSAQKTLSVLHKRRARRCSRCDTCALGTNFGRRRMKWYLTSVANWGEHPLGEWIVRIENDGLVKGMVVDGMRLELYGTVEKPSWMVAKNMTGFRSPEGIENQEISRSKSLNFSPWITFVMSLPNSQVDPSEVETIKMLRKLVEAFVYTSLSASSILLIIGVVMTIFEIEIC